MKKVKQRKRFMRWVKIGSPELSTGANKSSRSCDLENRGFGQTCQKKVQEQNLIFMFCGGLNSAGVDNKQLGPMGLHTLNQFLTVPTDPSGIFLA